MNALGCLWEAASVQDRSAELQEEDCSTELRTEGTASEQPGLQA